MATASKRLPSPKAKPATVRAAQPGAAPATEPFVRFYHSRPLRKKTLSVLDALEQAEEATLHRTALAEIVVELTNSGMDYYFLKPLKQAKPGFIVVQSANLGMTGVQQVMASVVRQVIGRMDGPALLSVCGSIRELIR